MKFEQLIREFVERIGYPSIPPPDGSGTYVFKFDGLGVTCQEREEGECLITGKIGRNEGEGQRREETVRRLMQVALVRAGRAHGVFTLDRSSNEFVLCHRLDSRNMEVAEFEEEMDQFLNELEFWVAQLGRESSASEGMKYPYGLRP